MILDTSFIIDVLRGRAEALRLLGELERSGPLRLPTVVLYELAEGAARARRPAEELELMLRALGAYPILDLATPHALSAGRLSAELQARGERLDDVDTLVAGVALAEGEEVVTRDDGFRRVPGLAVRSG